MKFTFAHINNSFNIKRLTPSIIFANKPRYCYYLKRSAYYPEIAMLDQTDQIITIQHELSVPNQVNIARSEELVGDWLKKNKPIFKDGVAFLILNNSPTLPHNFVIDYNDFDDKEVEYDLIEILRSKPVISSVVMVCTDKNFPQLYYNNTTSADMDSILITDIFKNLSFTKGVPANGGATDFMVEYIVESYKLRPTLSQKMIFIEELRNSEYMFPPHISIEEINSLFLEFSVGDIQDYPVEEGLIKPTLDSILYTEGLQNIKENVVLENDINLPFFDYVIATPITLVIYTLLEGNRNILSAYEYINEIMRNSVLLDDSYTVIQVDQQALDIIKRTEYQYASM